VQASVARQVVADTGGALERLFREHHATVLQAAYQITGNPSEAEDVLQTVFVRLLKREESQLAGLSRNYMRRAAVNAALDQVRSRRSARMVSLDHVTVRLTEKSAGPERLCSASELRKWIREAVARLSPRAAEMFALRFFQDISNSEIAELLGTSPGTVAVTLHRARSRLQNQIKSVLGEKS
jgi:RNA polymerase sigma-70 factor (ECF subfamily)